MYTTPTHHIYMYAHTHTHIHTHTHTFIHMTCLPSNGCVEVDLRVFVELYGFDQLKNIALVMTHAFTGLFSHDPCLHRAI